MKKFALVAVLLFSAVDAFACLGGRAELWNGKIVLTADNVTDENNQSMSTPDMQAGDYNITFDDNGFTIVKVAYIKSDSGGIIYTIYSIEKNHSTSYIKVESNYMGGGMMSRGLEVEPDFEISETFGC